MKNTDWKFIAELIGIAAIVASLIFVGIQIEQDQDLAQAEMRSSFDDRVIELANLTSANADTWIKGLKGEPLTPSEQLFFDSFARAIYVERINRFARIRLVSDYDGTAMAESFALSLYQYPGLRRFHNEFLAGGRQRMRILDRESQGPGAFVQVINKTLERLDAEKPPLPPADYLVY